MALDRPLRRAHLALFKGLHRMTRSTASAYTYFDAFTSELMVAIVPPEYWHEITVSLYSENRLLYSVHHHARLFDWERDVIATYFPPGARVLVGASGNGREMEQLIARGFSVAGFDPSRAALNRASARLDPQHVLALEPGTYQDLARGKLPAIEQLAPYGAVLLGWGSLSHVHDPADRIALFTHLRQLCPDAPVVFSWIREPPPGPHRETMRRVLRAVGAERPRETDFFRALVGFYSALTDQNIGELADASGYRLVAKSDQGPHAVFVPRD